MRRLGVRGAVVGGEYVAGDVGVADGAITAVGLPSGRAGVALPAFVDVQVNGYAGVDFLAADVPAWHDAARALAHDGVGAFLPTLITAPPEATAAALSTATQAMRTLPPDCARILGVHLEGPFLSPAKPGTHPVEWLRQPDPGLTQTWVDTGVVRLVTLAAELPGAVALVRQLVARGIVVSIGHSNAGAAEAHAAFDAGARTVTHLLNAMRPIAGREPGLAAVALSREDVAVQIICDGVHLADDTVKLVLASAGHRLMLVTDAIAATGVGDGVVQLGQVRVHVRGMEARRADGTLAGSVLTMAAAVRNAVAAGASLETAAAAATVRPAALLGAACGELRPGDPADLVVMNDDLHVRDALIAGESAGLPSTRKK